jgi:hypothetical protein
MLVQTSFSYRITGRMTGRVATRAYSFRERADFDVPCVNPDDAPVAAEWDIDTLFYKDKLRHPADSAVEASGQDRKQHTRFYQGRHWKRLTEGHVRGVAGQHADLGFDEFVRLGSSSGLDNLMGTKTAFKGKLVHSSPSHLFSEIAVDTRATALSEFRTSSARFMSVDGVMYRQCATPVLWLSRSNGQWGSKVPLVDTDPVRRILFSAGAPDVFIRSQAPLSLFDEVVSEYLRLEHTKDPEDRARIETLRPRILLQEAFPNDREDAADYFVEEYISNYGKDHFHDLNAYFGRRTAEGKLQYLESQPKSEWLTAGAHHPRPVDLIERALDLLDGRTIEFALPAFPA